MKLCPVVKSYRFYFEQHRLVPHLHVCRLGPERFEAIEVDLEKNFNATEILVVWSGCDFKIGQLYTEVLLPHALKLQANETAAHVTDAKRTSVPTKHPTPAPNELLELGELKS